MAPCPCLGRTPSALPWGILLAPHHGHCPAWEVVGRHSHPPGMEQTKRGSTHFPSTKTQLTLSL